jgi:hypothetical protein
MADEARQAAAARGCSEAEVEAAVAAVRGTTYADEYLARVEDFIANEVPGEVNFERERSFRLAGQVFHRAAVDTYAQVDEVTVVGEVDEEGHTAYLTEVDAFARYALMAVSAAQERGVPIGAVPIKVIRVAIPRSLCADQTIIDSLGSATMSEPTYTGLGVEVTLSYASFERARDDRIATFNKFMPDFEAKFDGTEEYEAAADHLHDEHYAKLEEENRKKSEGKRKREQKKREDSKKQPKISSFFRKETP